MIEHEVPHGSSSSAHDQDRWLPSAVLLGPPTSSFKDNLRNDTQYVTSWPSAGWTNDVMTYANLIYLARLTGRIPVVPAFVPSHIGGDAGTIAFGEVFNTTRLGEAIGIPVIEWQDVKTPGSTVVDEVGCWDVWQATQYSEDFPRRSGVPSQLSLDISYTKAPEWVKTTPGEINDKHASFWALASLGFPDVRSRELVPPRASDLHNVMLPPDEQMLCYDYLYYVCALQPFEWEYDYSPAWRFSAQHMRWTNWLEELSDWYVRQALDIELSAPTPPFISIHVRHHDFQVYCDDLPLSDCFAPIPVIARRVREVQAELLQKKGMDVTHIIMTSDEDDPAWWEEVYKQGWKAPDHTNTATEYGRWYPVLIDAVIQSNGAGFVGTARSTMSQMALLRCKTWHQGPTRMVDWGRIGADDH
ncbi:hypothetical protein FIBSPDRAFT_728362 [Athelia psychrophila]|uniref:Uncharacterized protein n=1 Tax=Athelia psychrophila TaxID=1759441 RepID=A0A166RYT8_9AGAM|nr:hypothetical protein FIBSPDRAFT_728362 [Fibularhizoctonia sp. CBS 109695]